MTTLKPPPTRPPVTERGAPTRDRILAAAAEVFAEHGFAGSGVDEIARRAEINKAMLYYHVGDKAALYSTVVREVIEKIGDGVSAAIAATEDPRQRLRGLFGAFLTVMRSHPHYPRIMLREIASGFANLPPEEFRHMTVVLAMTRRILDEGRAQGIFRDVNPLLTHLLVVGSVLFMSSAQQVRARAETFGVVPAGTPTDPTGLGDFLTEMILDGIAVRNSGADR